MKRWLVTFTCTLPMLAGMQGVDCHHPAVFPGAAVNVVLLPYDYIGANDVLERSRAAQELSLLLQRNALFSLLKYPNIASVQVTKHSGARGCEPQEIIDKLLGRVPGAKTRIGPDRSAVFLWGMLYEEGGALYVRSLLLLARNRSGGEELTMTVGEHKFTGAMPLKTVIFPPVRITAGELRQIEKQYRAFSLVRSKPSEAASGWEIPFDPEFSFAYVVGRAEGDWMHIEPLRSGPSGWVKAGASLGELPLGRKLPELSFLEAAVAYAFAVGAGANSQDSLRWSAQAVAALDRFVLDARLPDDSPVQASVATLRAAALLAKGKDPETWGFAQSLFHRASQLSPADSDLEQMDLLCRIWLTYRAGRRDPPLDLAAQLKGVAAQSDDPRSLDNLERFYRLLIEKGQADDSIRAELPTIGRIRGALPRN